MKQRSSKRLSIEILPQRKFSQLKQFGPLQKVCFPINMHFQKLSEKYASKQSLKVLHKQNRRELFRKIVKRLDQRAQTFYKYGFRYDQKKQHDSTFQDVFNLNKKALRVSFTVGELWSNKDNIKFLKENSMFMNKKNLVEQLILLQKENQKGLRQKRNSPLLPISLKSLEHFQNLDQGKTNKRKDCSPSISSSMKELNQDFSQLDKQLRAFRLAKRDEGSIIDYLEKSHTRLQKLQTSYANKMNSFY